MDNESEDLPAKPHPWWHIVVGAIAGVGLGTALSMLTAYLTGRKGKAVGLEEEKTFAKYVTNELIESGHVDGALVGSLIGVETGFSAQANYDRAAHKREIKQLLSAAAPPSSFTQQVSAEKLEQEPQTKR